MLLQRLRRKTRVLHKRFPPLHIVESPTPLSGQTGQPLHTQLARIFNRFPHRIPKLLNPVRMRRNPSVPRAG